MNSESDTSEGKGKNIQVRVQNTSAGSVYGLGLIGAWVYFFRSAITPEEKLKAFFKGLVWPAILVNQMLEFFGRQSNAEDE